MPGRQARIDPTFAKRLDREQMTKTSGEYQPPKPISKAEREARKAFREVDAVKAMSEHALAEKAFAQNRERLKAERLAREAAAGPAPKKQSRAKSK
ncbi:hypothetical protein FNV92_07005 [Bradyrhizobium cosmicum]